MSTLGSVRRYYLAKRHAASKAGYTALDALWQGKQEAEPGTALASGFPYLSDLQAAGYSTSEDLAGADVRELEEQGFTSREASLILSSI